MKLRGRFLGRNQAKKASGIGNLVIIILLNELKTRKLLSD